MNFYEINEDTLAIIPVDSKNSKVIEGDNQYVVSKSAYNIMDESCQYYEVAILVELLPQKIS